MDHGIARDHLTVFLSYARKDGLNRRKKRISLIVAQVTEDPEVPSSLIDLPRLNFSADASAAWTELC